MKLRYLPLIASATLFAACDDNEQPEFSDSEAFVAFNSATATVIEKSGDNVAPVTEIYVTLASRAGLSKTATIEIVDSKKDETYTAEESVNFEVIGSKELAFSENERTASLKLRYIPDGKFTGDMTFKLVLKSDDANIGHESECVVTLSDAEHPLQAILGSYKASADSYFPNRGHFDWNITFSKDESDVSKIWIDGLDPYFGSAGYKGHIYGTVDKDLTTISIPAKQAYGYKDSDGEEATIEFFSNADPDDENAMQLSDGDNATISINDGGATLTVNNSYGIYCGGWFNLMYGDMVITKN